MSTAPAPRAYRRACDIPFRLELPDSGLPIVRVGLKDGREVLVDLESLECLFAGGYGLTFRLDRWVSKAGTAKTFLRLTTPELRLTRPARLIASDVMGIPVSDPDQVRAINGDPLDIRVSNLVLQIRKSHMGGH